MMRLLSLFILGVSVGAVGCSREGSRGGGQRTASEANASLLKLFRAHGVDATPQGEWLVLSQHGMKANASVVTEIQHSADILAQLDLRFEIVPGRTLIESFPGVGETREQATASAFDKLTTVSFPVIMAAFLKHSNDQVLQEEWSIGGRPRQVTICKWLVLGKPPVPREQLADRFKVCEEKLKNAQIGPGTHWVSLQYSQMEDKLFACEVLLDNNVWEYMKAEVAAMDWPSGPDYYYVRVFLVVQDK